MKRATAMKKNEKKNKAKQFEELEADIWASSLYFCKTAIQALYEWAQEEVINELSNLYMRNEGDLTRTDIYRKLKLEAIFGQLGKKLDDLTTERLTDVVKSTETGQREIVGMVDWNFFNDREVESIVKRDFQGKDFSQRIWKNTEELAKRVKQDITRIVVTGNSPSKITEQLAKDFNVGYKKAERLVRTETSRVFVQSALEGFKKAQYNEFAIEVKDIGPYPCKECEEKALNANGTHKRYTLATLPVIPEHPNCRCRPVPFVFLNED